MFLSLGRIVFWSILPDYGVRYAVAIYHDLLRMVGQPIPPYGSTQWQRNYRGTYAIVSIGTLVYNLYQSIRDTPTSFYDILGIPPDSDENALKNAFRSFAKKYHPDRIGPEGSALFMSVRTAYESLKNPTTRFAFERFGPAALEWRDCTTPREYIIRGLWNACGFYLVFGAFLFLLPAVKSLWSSNSRRDPFSFWRYVFLVALLASELCLLTGPGHSSGLLGLILPRKAAYQQVVFLHHLFVVLTVTMSKVLPALFPQEILSQPDQPTAYAPYITKLNVLAKTADREISRVLHTELHAFHGSNGSALADELKPCQPSEEVMNTLTTGMEDLFIENVVHNQLPIRSLWAKAIENNINNRSKERKRRELEIEEEEDVEVEEEGEKNNPVSRSRVTTTLVEGEEDVGVKKLDKKAFPTPPGSVSPEQSYSQLPVHPEVEVTNDEDLSSVSGLGSGVGVGVGAGAGTRSRAASPDSPKPLSSDGSRRDSDITFASPNKRWSIPPSSSHNRSHSASPNRL